MNHVRRQKTPVIASAPFACRLGIQVEA